LLYPGLVRNGIIDGERWIAQRMELLREGLTGELSGDERTAIEAELEVLSRERGLTVGGRRTPRFLRRLGSRK
jgi:hypothetical protein